MGILARSLPAAQRVAEPSLLSPRRLLVKLWLPATIVILWQIGSTVGLLDPLFFPAPTELASSAVRLIRSGELPAALGVTLKRAAAGFAIGAGGGLLLGLLMGAFSFARDSFEPIVSALFTTPKMSLLPMLMLLFGVGDPARIALIAVGVFVIVTLHATDAVRSIDATYIDMAKNYGANRAMIFRKVYVPASLPALFTGIRLGAGRALVITVAVELISCPDGIGSMIWMSWQTLATEKLYVGIVLTAVLGAISHTGLRWMERRITPWRQG
jgi:ABC-type nitrate/sulfonate/bicarbonate transport system permease component